MTIQISRGKSLYQFKINEYNDRQILMRRNRHNVRWTHHSRHDSAKDARQAILRLEKEGSK